MSLGQLYRSLSGIKDLLRNGGQPFVFFLSFKNAVCVLWWKLTPYVDCVNRPAFAFEGLCFDSHFRDQVGHILPMLFGTWDNPEFNPWLEVPFDECDGIAGRVSTIYWMSANWPAIECLNDALRYFHSVTGRTFTESPVLIGHDKSGFYEMLMLCAVAHSKIERIGFGCTEATVKVFPKWDVIAEVGGKPARNNQADEKLVSAKQIEKTRFFRLPAFFGSKGRNIR